MPLISRNAIMAAKAYGQNVNASTFWFGSTSAAAVNWNALNGGAVNAWGYSPATATDTKGNVYIAGSASLTSSFVIKYNAFGQVLWQKTISNLTVNDIDVYRSDDSVYICGYDSTNLGWYAAKLDSSGNLTATRNVISSPQGHTPYGIVVNQSTGTVYVCGTTTTFTKSIFVVSLSNSLGVPSTSLIFNGSGSFSNDPGGIALLSNNNFVVQAGNTCYLVNSSFTVVASTIVSVYGGSAVSPAPSSNVVTDASNNIYLIGNGSSSVIQKLNSSLVSQWQTIIPDAGGSSQAVNCAVSANGTVYALATNCNNYSGTGNYSVVSALNSSGSLIWTNKISAGGILTRNTTFSGLTIAQANGSAYAVYVTGAQLNGSAGEYTWIGKLPADGSRAAINKRVITGMDSVYYEPSFGSAFVTTGTSTSTAASTSSYTYTSTNNTALTIANGAYTLGLGNF